jgi:hypothetical protein
MPGIPIGDAPSILNKSYTITAEVEIPKEGADGMLVTLGGRQGLLDSFSGQLFLIIGFCPTKCLALS